MKGRNPKPGELREAQGNPGHRAIVTALPDDGPVKGLPFAKLGEDARRAYEIIAGDLRRMKFVRASDESLLLRYCDLLARYWRSARKLDELGSETYTVKTVSGDMMDRLRPELQVMLLVSKRLDSMEDRLGLSPMARQQYLVRMAAVGASPQLPMDMPETPDQPSPRTGSPVGFLRNKENRTLQ